MTTAEKIWSCIKNPWRIFFALGCRGWFSWTPDETYLKFMFRGAMGYWPNLKKPNTFNEKLQWLKLHDRNPLYTNLVDKYEVKKIVASILGEEYIIPTLGVWDKFDDIDFDSLPNQFVLKCTHDSGGLVICRDKNKLNINTAREKIEKCLKTSYYKSYREWPYKNVKPRIIAEQFMEESSEAGLPDYKFFCFNSDVDCVMLCLDRHIGDTKFYFFDKKWNLLRYNIRGKAAPADFSLPKPQCIDEMFRIASKLSTNHPFSRIDLYQVKGKVYFGEITFYPDSGFDANLLPETDAAWNNKLLIKE